MYNFKIKQGNQPLFDKFLTHWGRFHADETAAAALAIELLGFDPKNIIRKKAPTKEELASRKIAVVDFGGDYSRNLANMDHHQNGALPSACILFFDFVVKSFLDLTKEQAAALGVVREKVLLPISQCDRFGSCESMAVGHLEPKERMLPIVEVIRGLNWIEDKEAAFWQAVEFMRTTIRAVYFRALALAQAADKWAQWVTITEDKSAAIQFTGSQIAGWESLAEDAGVNFLIARSTRDEGEYILISRDSKAYPIQLTGEETFSHPTRFIAGYKTIEAAQRAAQNK